MRRPGILERRAPDVRPRVVRASAAAAPAFSPSSLPGLFMWFDMQDPAAYTESGGVVTQVINKASATAWTEATNRPAFSATGMNGFPCADHDGTNDKFMSTEAAVFTALADQNDYYCAFVISADDLDAVECFFGVADLGVALNNSKRWGTNTTGNGKWTVAGNDSAGAGIVVDSTADTVTTVVLLEFYSESQLTSIRVNGGAEAPADTASAYGTLTPNRSAIGCRPSSALATFFDGRWGEMVGCGLTSDANKALLRAYLIAKWGIS